MPDPVTPEELNQRFAIDKHLHFEGGPGGLVRAQVEHPSCRGTIYLHGAQVASWAPAGHDEVLFVSAKSRFGDTEEIRGGVPICFPWFGPHPSDPAAPRHGIARTRGWVVTSAEVITDGVRIEMATVIEPFRVTHRVTFGPTLRMTLHVENGSDREARYEEALHTYFAIGDVREAEITGLEGADYIDKVDGGQRKTQQGPIRFVGETDRIYVNTQATCLLKDPRGGRTIRVAKEGSNSTVVWNPWIAKAAWMEDFGDDEWPNMVCIETCNVVGDAVVLAPGAGHEMTAEIGVE